MYNINVNNTIMPDFEKSKGYKSFKLRSSPMKRNFPSAFKQKDLDLVKVPKKHKKQKTTEFEKLTTKDTKSLGPTTNVKYQKTKTVKRKSTNKDAGVTDVYTTTKSKPISAKKYYRKSQKDKLTKVGKEKKKVTGKGIKTARRKGNYDVARTETIKGRKRVSTTKVRDGKAVERRTTFPRA